MPTTTSTVTEERRQVRAIQVKATTPSPSPLPSSTATTLRTLYNRAARAFLTRDIVQTQSLLETAVSLLQPPILLPDPLAGQRRKWDILRITLETTIHSSPPPQASDSLPDSLRQVLLQTPHALINAIYARSLAFFTVHKSTIPVFLPFQVLVTLVYSSLKLECPDVGRVMIEDWLSRRHSSHEAPDDQEGDGYDKILELYCLQVLPKLEQWDYAFDFLEYENELSTESRELLKQSLLTLRDEAFAYNPPTSSTPSSLPSSSSSSPRPYSPAPSSSSSSSSMSTASTHTVVPATPRPNRGFSALTSQLQASVSTASLSSNETARPNGTQSHSPQRKSKSRSPSSSSSRPLPLSHSRSHQTTSVAQPSRRSPPSAYALVKAALSPYFTSNNVPALLIVFILLPLLSLIIRLRKRRRLSAESNIAANTANLVRQRLNGQENWSLWGTIFRVLVDTIKMAGSGLV